MSFKVHSHNPLLSIVIYIYVGYPYVGVPYIGLPLYSSASIEYAKRRCIDHNCEATLTIASAPPTLAAARLEAVRARVTAREAAATFFGKGFSMLGG